MASIKMVTCPYDAVHKLKESRIQIHISKCRLNHMNEEKFICPFNATHVLPIPEKSYHLSTCPDRAQLDNRLLADSITRNNPFRGRTAVPSYTESNVIVPDETWDDDNFTYSVPNEPPPGAMYMPKPLLKPAERKQIYKELPKELPDSQANTLVKTVQPSGAAASPIKPVLRQPRSVCEAAVSANQTFNPLAGRGRGLPASRIAASIYTGMEGHGRHEPVNYSDALTGSMQNLGLGRGIGHPSRIDNDYDEFPALGIGRGRKQN